MEDKELVENALLMPIGGEKQPDIVLEIKQQNGKKPSASTTNSSTIFANTTENQEDIDSDAMLVLDTPDEQTKNKESDPKPKKRTSNGTLVIRSYKLRHKADNTTNQKNKLKPKSKTDSDRKKQSESGPDSRSTTDKYKIKRTKQNGMTYYHCGYCMKIFDSLQHLNNHHKRKHNPVTCDICNKQFATPNTLIRHAYGHLAKLCDQTFHFQSEVSQHMDVHVREPKYQCNNCDCKFIRKSDLIAHAEGHTKIWTCKFAGSNKTVMDKRYLNSHYKTHSDEIKYPCSKCDRRFKFNEQRK